MKGAPAALAERVPSCIVRQKAYLVLVALEHDGVLAHDLLLLLGHIGSLGILGLGNGLTDRVEVLLLCIRRGGVEWRREETARGQDR